MIKEFAQFDNKSELEYKIGDAVKVYGTVDDKRFNGEIYTIEDIIISGEVYTNMYKNKEISMEYPYKGVLYLLDKVEWAVPPYNLKAFKQIFTPEDPLGEEDWD